jgi:hypothetical protein
VATTPEHENPIRSYPDHLRSRTTAKYSGAKPASKSRKKTKIPMRIARIETVPMTDEELHKAAEALAVLLNHFWREHPDQAA